MKWKYKDHICEIADKYIVTLPNGVIFYPDLNPNDGTKEIVNKWIDAKYPLREDLELLLPLCQFHLDLFI